jgi:hypothetical protein
MLGGGRISTLVAADGELARATLDAVGGASARRRSKTLPPALRNVTLSLWISTS